MTPPRSTLISHAKPLEFSNVTIELIHREVAIISCAGRRIGAMANGNGQGFFVLYDNNVLLSSSVPLKRNLDPPGLFHPRRICVQ
jgi:hypothetical protein